MQFNTLQHVYQIQTILKHDYAKDCTFSFMDGSILETCWVNFLIKKFLLVAIAAINVTLDTSKSKLE